MSRHRPDSLILKSGRRRFLAGSAGLLALPFLESIVAPNRAGAWAPAAGMPSRLIVFFHGHGSIMEEFVPGAGFTQGAILQPVVDVGLASKMNVITGINSKVESGHSGAPSILTCAPVVANEYGVTHATTASVDHVIGRHMQDGGPPRRFDVGVHNGSLDPEEAATSLSHTRMFWAGEDEHIPSIIKPQEAFDLAFPGAGMPAPPPEPGVDIASLRRRSVLNGVLGRFMALRGRVSRADQARLDRHADQLRDLERSIQDLPPDVTRPPACDTPTLGSTASLTHETVANLQVDTLAQAMACNQADVGTYKLFDMEEGAWGHVVHPDLAATFAGENYHGAWHRASDMSTDYARRAFTGINTWFGSLFARLLQRLDSIDEGDGTALDHTMVVWLSDFGHGGGHRADNLPIVVAGNAAGTALGRHINYADNPAASYGADSQPGNHNLAVTMAQSFGIEGDRFGDYDGVYQPVSPGPLTF